MTDFNELFKKETEKLETDVGTSKNSNIKKNYHFYHVIQQTANRRNYFTSDAARHRESLILKNQNKYGVFWLASVVMPTHTHDLIMVKDISSFFRLIKGVNRGTSTFIRKYRKENFQKETSKVFDSFPGYVPIKSRAQMLILLKYMYENPTYLKNENKTIPLSCFDQWSAGNFKNYNIEIIENVLEIKRNELIENLENLDSVSFAALANYRYRNDNKDEINKLLKK